jgi:molybdate transport system substrate-binding protein
MRWYCTSWIGTGFDYRILIETANRHMKRIKIEDQSLLNRRAFLTTAAGAAAGSAIPSSAAAVSPFRQSSLQVWACGGLAEAFIPANKRYKAKTGIEIAFTGAFAAALGKSLMGSATTEVFAGRVLGLAQKLRKSGKMDGFRPLCFTSYVLVTPKGNPAGISSIQDLAKPGVRVILAPDASPPGGEAVTGLLKKAGVLDQAMKNAAIKGSCVQRTMEDLVKGKGDVSVVECRLTRMPLFNGKVEVLPIPEIYFPPGPLTFTIGVMKNATDKAMANHFIDFILSEEGQGFFKSAGFIPAMSDEGRRLIEKLGVKDV